MSQILSEDDYLVLAVAAEEHPLIGEVLNDNGCANWTVCPVCRVDDFIHVEGCAMIGRIDFMLEHGV